MQQTSTITCPYCTASNPTNATICVTCGSRIVAVPSSQAEHKDSLPAGTILGNGRFQIVNEIARGGFGITYLAFDTQAKNYAAVKECFPEGLVTRGSGLKVIPKLGFVTEFQAALKHFQREADTLKTIVHRSAPRLIGSEVGNDTFYLFMEYLQGQTLEARIQSGKFLTENDALEMLKPILELLTEVHSKGLLHRDIKPANIIVTRDQAELIDFGSTVGFTNGKRSKVTSRFLTPAYAPLEQYGEEVSLTPATDLYALGATFYEALSGIKPPSALDRANGMSLRPLKELNLRLSDKITSVIEQSLEMRIENRFSSAAIMLENLMLSQRNWNNLGKINPTANQNQSIGSMAGAIYQSFLQNNSLQQSSNPIPNLPSNFNHRRFPKKITTRAYSFFIWGHFAFLVFMIFFNFAFDIVASPTIDSKRNGITSGFIKICIYTIILFIFRASMNIYLESKTTSFVKTQGVVVKNEIIKHDKTTDHILEYVYINQNTYYRGNRNTFMTPFFVSSELIQNPLHSQINVYFDPENPSQSVLRQGFTADSFILYYILAFIGIGVGLLLVLSNFGRK
jgi:serine/threonine protein kinase